MEVVHPAVVKVVNPTWNARAQTILLNVNETPIEDAKSNTFYVGMDEQIGTIPGPDTNGSTRMYLQPGPPF